MCCSELFPQPELETYILHNSWLETFENVLFCCCERAIALFLPLPRFFFQVGVPEHLHFLRSMTTDKKSASKLNKWDTLQLANRLR